MGTSELNFHIWNANSQSFARAKSEAKMAAHGENFGRQFQSFARLSFLVLFGSALEAFPAMESVLRRNITGLVLLYQEFKRIHYCRVA